MTRGVAQLAERCVWDAEVGGSSPPTPTVYITPSSGEATVRSARVRPGVKKVDLVVTSARYQNSGERLVRVRAFARRGSVWGDTELIDRQDLTLRLRRGERIVAGRESELPGDFELGHRLRLEDDAWIVAEGGRGGRDDLGVPLF